MKTLYITSMITALSLGIISCGGQEKTSNSEENQVQKIEISKATTGGYLLVGLEHLGDYHKITSKIDSIKSYLKTQGKDSEKVVAVYFDDEEKVNEAELQSFTGFIVKDSSEAASIVSTNSKFKMHYVAAKEGFYTESSFSNWETLVNSTTEIYNQLLAKIQETHSHITEKESAIEEYQGNSVRFILQID